MLRPQGDTRAGSRPAPLAALADGACAPPTTLPVIGADADTWLQTAQQTNIQTQKGTS